MEREGNVMKVLPENYLRCLTPDQRKSIGQKSASEVMALGEAKTEKILQRQIVQLLRLKGIEVNVSRMDKRKTDVVGWPDLTFTVSSLKPYLEAWRYFACLWEIKLPQGKLSPEQEQMHKRLQAHPNAWRVRIIRSVDEAIAALLEMGIE